MKYLARFEEVSGQLFRFDTRIYLESLDLNFESVCVGAIVGINPGSASSNALNQLLPLDLKRDQMLPFVGNRFLDGYRRAKKPIPPNAFVRVWNLFYVCNPDLGAALEIASKITHLPTCPSENDSVSLVWYGWGGNNMEQNSYKVRYLQKKHRNQFFYNHRSAVIVQNAPAVTDFAKHTQGMPTEPVVQYLAKVL